MIMIASIVAIDMENFLQHLRRALEEKAIMCSLGDTY